MLSKHSSRPDDEQCSACGSPPITDNFTGELVCSSCGVVLKERVETLSPEWRSFSSADNRARGGFPSSLLIYDTGLSTYIGTTFVQDQKQQGGDQENNNNNKNEGGSVYVHRASCPIPVNRLRKLNAMSVSSAPVSRNLKKATWEINRICSSLGLAWQVAERSAYFYRKALQKNLIKGRSISGFVAASVYLACKERMIPRTIDEVCRATGVDRPFATRCYKILVSEMHIEPPPITDPFRNIAKISTRAGIEERVSRRAMEILSSVTSHTTIMGKNPLVLAAAALYLATVEHKLNMTKTMIADAAEVSTISLRKRLADITCALEDLSRR
ncbi:transcription initiation factor IIB [Candidatus Nitrososphaera gargensis Ga9.2]|uniref:Transcription initiation factor IIB n=1 Tax=Nitrososphaera gargensis (strain Ga9.2) TaxID=1237085 RepID=K0IKH9_NITGG|nr:TFIIB-type zinc ribbon-containing protein [Candidatus Nitrososphaera gargensis]AFU59773.1 transcription initiation factor IIB [Candidatus Nitrososphaera gargensis Ga9.2]